VNRLLQNQAEVIEAERMALVAEQHKELEKLIAAISASVNRDLPLRMEEMIRREVAGLGGSIAGTLAASLRSLVGPACQSALAEALPRDLAGPQLQVRFPLSSLIQVFSLHCTQKAWQLRWILLNACTALTGRWSLGWLGGLCVRDTSCFRSDPCLLVAAGGVGEGAGVAAAHGADKVSAGQLPQHLPGHPHPSLRGRLPDHVLPGAPTDIQHVLIHTSTHIIDKSSRKVMSLMTIVFAHVCKECAKECQVTVLFLVTGSGHLCRRAGGASAGGGWRQCGSGGLAEGEHQPRGHGS
jgi:hypothetical protein